MRLNKTVILRISMGLTILGMASGGCSGPLDPAATLEPPRPASVEAQATGGGLFYPLDLGNHWSYRRTFAIYPCATSDCPPLVFRSTLEADLIGTAQRFGREYVVQRETYHDPQQVIVSDYLYRQDRGGLYSADVEPAAAPASTERVPASIRDVSTERAARLRGIDADLLAQVMLKHARIRELVLHGRLLDGPGLAPRPQPQPGEIPFLRYPLHPQATWNVRQDPRVIYTVEGQEVLDLPAGRFTAWRIRIDWPDFFGPHDWARVWYGRSGFLALRDHLLSEGRDENGNPTGPLVGEETETLTELSLVR